MTIDLGIFFLQSKQVISSTGLTAVGRLTLMLLLESESNSSSS